MQALSIHMKCQDLISVEKKKENVCCKFDLAL